MERLSAKQKSELGDVLLGQIEKKNAPTHALRALRRLGARVLLYAPVLGWKGESLALSAAELRRASRDRARPDDALRQRLADRLRQACSDGARLAQLVLEPIAPVHASEKRLAFGDTLLRVEAPRPWRMTFAATIPDRKM